MEESRADAAGEPQKDPALATGKSLGSNSSSESSPRRNIFLHFEVLRPRTHKVAQAIWFTLVAAGVALVAVVMYLRGRKDDTYYLQSGVLFKLHTGLAVICLSILLPMLGWFTHSIWVTKEFPWLRRQRYLVAVAYLELLVQCVNVAFWLIPNVFILIHPCSWIGNTLVDTSTYIRWTCWNTVFLLQLIHAHNCSPVLTRKSKDEDAYPDRGNPKYGNNDKDPMVLDSSFFYTHWTKLGLWCIVQGSILYMPIAGGIDWKAEPVTPAPAFCPQQSYRVMTGAKYTVARILWASAVLLYQSNIQLRLQLALRKLQTQPYNCYQFAHLLLLWQRRQTTWMQLLGVCEVTTIYFGYQTLVNYIMQWTGQITMQVLLSAATVLNAFYLLPTEPSNEEHVYQAWLQEFAWTSGQIVRRKQQLLGRSPSMGPRLQQQPVFCMETALKLVLWSNLVYEDAAEGHLASLRECLDGGKANEDSLVGSLGSEQPDSSQEGTSESEPGTSGRSSRDQTALVPAHAALENEEEAQQSQDDRLGEPRKSIGKAESCHSGSSISERRLTEDGVLSPERPGHKTLQVEDALSGPEALNLAMRMYELTELVVVHSHLTDTKAVIAWSGQAMVLAFRGTNSLKNVKSDARAWRAVHPPARGKFCLGTMPLVHRGFLEAWSEVREEVLARVKEVLDAALVALPLFEVFVTGHSLGGALATLAAFDIQKEHRLRKLACYTYGAPRTGNKAFAREFAQLCPDCWHVINDKDAVPRTGKMVWLYKRPGERVLLSTMGDIRVRPTVFEINLHTSGLSLKQHQLAAYMRALGCVCVAQLMKYKQIEGGAHGVKRLSRNPEICELLAAIGLDLNKAVEGAPLEFAGAKKTKRGRKAFKCDVAHSLLEMARDMKPLPGR